MQHDKPLAYWVSADFGLLLRLERRLLRQQTAYQVLEVCDTPALGRLFCLDGVPMTAVGDEFIYHETLVHPMAIAHPAPRTALIVGGGDGGFRRVALFGHEFRRSRRVDIDHRFQPIGAQEAPALTERLHMTAHALNPA